MKTQIQAVQQKRYVLVVHFPPEQSGRILSAALASVYGKEDGGSDTAVWLAGSKEEAGLSRPSMGNSSIVHETIVALRQIGLLDDIINTKEGWCIRQGQ